LVDVWLGIAARELSVRVVLDLLLKFRGGGALSRSPSSLRDHLCLKGGWSIPILNEGLWLWRFRTARGTADTTHTYFVSTGRPNKKNGNFFIVIAGHSKG